MYIQCLMERDAYILSSVKFSFILESIIIISIVQDVSNNGDTVDGSYIRPR